MDKQALYSLSYGVFLLCTKSGEKKNGCITNTCIQVAANPTRIAISVINANYTCELLKESGVFTMTLLDENCAFDTIKYWGMQSGRNVDKFANLKMPEDEAGVPYMPWQSVAVISAKVVSSQDLGSHTLFIAEVTDAKMLGEGTPMTYAHYQSDVKPKPEKKPAEKKIIGWRCKICKYVYEGETLPADFECPLCGHGPEDFEPIYAE